MKRVIVFCICLLLLTTGCQREEAVNKPYTMDYERINKYDISKASPAPLSFFGEAADSAELVAHVKIKGWATDYDSDNLDEEYSILVAEVIDTFDTKSKLEKTTIYILQTTSSKVMRSGYPLFKPGDELLLCLETEPTDSEPVYYISNGQWGVLQIFMSENDTYVINRAYEEFLQELAGEEVTNETREAVLEALYEYDPVLKAYARPFFEIYRYEVLVEYLEGII